MYTFPHGDFEKRCKGSRTHTYVRRRLLDHAHTRIRLLRVWMTDIHTRYTTHPYVDHAHTHTDTTPPCVDHAHTHTDTTPPYVDHAHTHTDTTSLLWGGYR